MKKIFFVAVLFSATTFAFAQTKTAEAYDAVEASRTMANNLMLNEGQYLQIKALNNVKQERYRDIDALYANDPEMRQQKMDALNAEMDMEYQKVLKPDQYQSYLELEGRTSASSETMGSDMITPASDQMNMGETDGMDTDQTDPATGTKTEMKIKSGDVKVKSEPGKTKIETPNSEAKTKTSRTETKSKMERPDGSQVKEESDKDGYKYQDSRDNSKVKVKDDKLKIEDKNGKIKVEDDKVKIKSRD